MFPSGLHSSLAVSMVSCMLGLAPRWAAQVSPCVEEGPKLHGGLGSLPRVAHAAASVLCSLCVFPSSSLSSSSPSLFLIFYGLGMGMKLVIVGGSSLGSLVPDFVPAARAVLV